MSPWCVNSGFIIGNEKSLVVDTGGNTLAAQTIHGYASIARPTNELCAINTEKHFDHIGGNGYFRSLGIDVWGHKEIMRTRDEFQVEIAEFNDTIANPARRARFEAQAFFYGTSLTQPNCPIQDDLTFNLGDLSVEILLTPGHTPTNICVWVPDDGVLFTGDCLIREYLPNLDAGKKEDWQLWLKSLERIEFLKPEFVVTGHGPVSRGCEIPAVISSVRQILKDSILRGCSPTSSTTGRERDGTFEQNQS